MPEAEATAVAIFWDYENCRPPSNFSGHKIVQNIRRSIEPSGPVKVFKAYVDTSLECVNPRSVTLHSELQSSGVTLAHCPHNGKKDVTDKMMIVDMLSFALDNHAPATIVMVTGDRDFAYAAAVLRLRGYKIVMFSPGTAHSSLKTQADALFNWQNIMCDAISDENSADGAMLSAGSSETAVTNHVEDKNCLENLEPRNSQEGFSKAIPLGWSDALLAEPVRNLDDASTKSDTQRDSAVRGIEIMQMKSQPLSVTSAWDPYRTRDLLSTPQTSSRVEKDEDGPSESPISTSFAAKDDAWDENDSETNYESMADSASSALSDSPSPSVSVLIPTSSGVIDLSSVRRFGTLIEYFYNHRDATQETEQRSSVVAAEMLKINPAVYKDAGVTKMKEYIEEAQLANVIVAPAGLVWGDCWIEINSDLYDIYRPYKAGVLPSEGLEETGQPSTKAIIIVKPVYRPLIDHLRTFPYRVPYSVLGSYLKAEHPYLYDLADVQTLSQYLQEAEEQGIVILSGGYRFSTQPHVQLVSSLEDFDSVSYAWY